MTAASALRLSQDELAFFRLTCALFPNPESPLRDIEDLGLEPEEPDAVYTALCERGLLDADSATAAGDVAQRIAPVSECSARVTVITRAGSARKQIYYVSAGWAVEYASEGDAHLFGDPVGEDALAEHLAAAYSPSGEVWDAPLRLSAGDYLVFAVFARDVRASEEIGRDDNMSIDEVLAYFDEPETKYVRMPNDETWQRSLETLSAQEVLVETELGYALHERYHPLALQLVADHDSTISRVDFLDEQWLVREVSLYPTDSALYRLGTEPDGTVVIEALGAQRLHSVLERVVRPLPNVLDDSPSVRHPGLG